jgi:hypothetical protein
MKNKLESETEKAIREIEGNTEKALKNNPGISTYDVYEREKARIRKFTGMASEGIKTAFTIALGRRLGEEIEGNGKKKIEGMYCQQLEIFKL